MEQMTAMDRRSGNERRSVNRFNVVVNIDWEAESGRRSGTLSDISSRGCFVLASGGFSEGDPVKLFLPAGDGMKIEFTGEVANHAFEIGFALRFDNVSQSHLSFLSDFVKNHREN